MRGFLAHVGFWLLKHSRTRRMEARNGDDGPLRFVVYIIDDGDDLPAMMGGMAQAYATLRGVEIQHQTGIDVSRRGTIH